MVRYTIVPTVAHSGAVLSHLLVRLLRDVPSAKLSLRSTSPEKWSIEIPDGSEDKNIHTMRNALSGFGKGKSTRSSNEDIKSVPSDTIRPSLS